MIIALFGGSFDPIHLGHENVVRSLLDAQPDIDRLIIMPARVNPFKLDKRSAVSPEDRLEMCRLAFAHIEKCVISDYEIMRDTPSYTVETIRYLKSQYNDAELILAVGSDSLESLPRWYEAEEIIKSAVICAVSRSDEDISNIRQYALAVEKMGGTVRIINAEPFEISSTELREKIRKNENIACYINENVVNYIREKNIYC